MTGLAADLERISYLRGPTGKRQHREWFHFFLLTPEVDLLANFSLTYNPDLSSEPVYRLLVMARSGESWAGDVFDTADAVAPAGGFGFDSSIGGFRFRHGEFQLTLNTEAVACQLRMRPASELAYTNSVSLSGHGAIRWVAMPHLISNGSIEIGEKQHQVADAATYHDHNWGKFSWGDDFSWEWLGFSADTTASAEPVSGVFTRISDRYGHATLSQALMLWHEGKMIHALAGSELGVHRSGISTARTRYRVPRVASLATPGSHADIPACFDITAQPLGRELSVQVRPGDNTQIVIPDDTRDDAITLINESRSTVNAVVPIGGQTLAVEGVGLFEQISSTKLR